MAGFKWDRQDKRNFHLGGYMITKQRQTLRSVGLDSDERCLLIMVHSKSCSDNISSHRISNSDKIFQRCMRMYQRIPMRYTEKAGIDKYFSVHSFRSNFMTSLIKRGWSYDAIQKLTGHISIASLKGGMIMLRSKWLKIDSGQL